MNSSVFHSRLGRKAQEHVWWVIIGAVIALVVLAVVIYIFVSRTQAGQQSLSSCQDKGGICAPGNCPSGTLSTSAFECAGSDTCCLGFAVSCTIATTEEDCEEGTCQTINGKDYCVPS